MHVAENLPPNTRLIAEHGEVKIFSMEQRPDVLVKVWLRKSNDVRVTELLIRLGLLVPVKFKVNITGPQENIIEITWTENEEDHAPNIGEAQLKQLHLAMSNVSGGDKTLSFIMYGCSVITAVPHTIEVVNASSWLFQFPLKQLSGVEMGSRSNINIHGGMSVAKALVNQEEKGV